MTKRLFFISLFAFISVGLFAQTHEIFNGTVTACSGNFYDDNGGVDDVDGTVGDNYSPTSYTYTICPENAGDGIQVGFGGFSLAQNATVNNSDRLIIYDGDDTSADLLGDTTPQNGTYFSFGNTIFAATADNPSGCLTFRFIHNNQNTPSGGWQASIECVTPCSTPTANGGITAPVPDINNSVQVCIGDEISFSDFGSQAGSNQFSLVNYIWDFGDETSSIGPQNVTHTYDVPGEYIVSLAVEDDNGCLSANITPYQVLVSTIPIFNTEFTDEVCIGGVGTIDGNPLQNVTWTNLPPQVVSGQTNLQDGVGFEYESPLTFNFFEEGQVLEDCSDLESIFVNIEHAYMGDLDISIECPDGTTVLLVDQDDPDNGGGIFLGEPIDDVYDLSPGVGYDYFWDPTATNGTWGENAGNAEEEGEETLPSGSYESNFDMCALVGCPLNGEWTLSIVDNLASDDGNIFEWGLNLNPALFPGVTTFTPQVGETADSSFVTGPNIISTSNDGNVVEFVFTEVGEYEFIYTAINDFSCRVDTPIVITVNQGPIISGGDDLEICGDPVELGAEIVSNDFFVTDYVFSWTPEATLDDPNVLNPFSSATQATTYTVVVHPEGWEGCASTSSVTVAPNPSVDPGLDTSIELCSGLGMFELLSQLQGTPVDIGTWTDAAGNPIDGSQSTVDIADGVYTYTVGLDGCVLSSELEIAVSEPLAMSITNTFDTCSGDPVSVGIETLTGGMGTQSIQWTSNGAIVGDTETLTLEPTASAEYCVEVSDLCPGETIGDCMNINVEAFPAIDIAVSSNTGCEPYEIFFENLTDESLYVDSYWNVGEANYTNEDTLRHLYYTPGLYDVNLTLKSALGCTYNQEFPNHIQIYASPEPFYTYDPYVTTIPDTEFNFENLTEDTIVSHFWEFDTLGTSYDTDPTFMFPMNVGGTYPVSLTVVDMNGCTSTYTKDIIVNDLLNVFIPSGFTPNADGLNDALFFYGTDINTDRFNVKIFNRWGEVVYESNDITEPWDGSHKDGDYYVKEGVYNYFIETYSLGTTKRLEIHGHVSVIR